MKILYGITKSNFGGAQRYVFDLACEAKRLGHSVAVLCGGGGELVRRLGIENIRVVSLPSLERNISLIKDFKEFVSMVKTLFQERPDVFHTNSSKMGGLGAVAGRLVGIPHIVFTSHGWAFNENWRPGWQKLLIKIFSWLIVVFSHETICVSEKTRDNISSWPFIKNKLVVIYNGLENFELEERDVARHKLGVTSDETIVVGTLAELHRVKGLDILLEAWQILASNSDARNLQLIIVGGGEEEKNLKNMAKNLNLEAGPLSVSFLGFVSEARNLLSGFDILVLPSRSENLPYVILEAGVASLPIVASSVGGIPEIIADNENGLLVKAEDAGELARKLEQLIRDGELRKRLGSDLQKTILEKFSKEEMFEKTFASYRAS